MMNSKETSRLFPLPLGSRGLKFAFYGFFLAYFSILLIVAWEYDWRTKLFPYVVGIPTIALIIIQLTLVKYPNLREKFSSNKESKFDVQSKLNDAVNGSKTARSRGKRQKYEIIIFGWIFSLLALLYLFGFAYVLPGYVLAFLWYFLRDLKIALAISFVFSLGVYILFFVILGLSPLQGALSLPDLINYLPS